MDFLNYHHLRYFWLVAREGGLKRAAEKVHVSQPTMSAQIQALEQMLGEKLFHRGGRNLTLTETGHGVYSYADEIFSIGHELVRMVKQQRSARPLRVHIGITDSLPKLITYEILKPIFRLPQPASVVCREGKPADLLGQMAAFRLDLVLADEPAPSATPVEAFNHLLGECGLVFCAEPKLAARLKRNFPNSLDNAPALLPTANTAVRRSLDKWFLTRNIRPRLVAECEDAALLAVMALAGQGFLPMPSVVAQKAVDRFGLRTIGTAPDCQQQFYAISVERKLTHPAVLAITSQARAVLSGTRKRRRPLAAR